MKRALFKVILPALAIGIWVLTCYPVCNKAEGFDFFLFWILAGFPFGIRKMCMVLIPKNFGIAGSMGVWALNAVVGGLIGGVVLIIKVLGMAVELVKIIAGHNVQKFRKLVNSVSDVGAVRKRLLLCHGGSHEIYCYSWNCLLGAVLCG